MARPADAGEELPRRIIESFQAISAAQSELGRTFARRMRLHPTDSTAIVEIIRAEDRGRPLTPARLSERIGLTSGATSILLNRLEAAGHIRRARGHSDRRLVTLHSAEAVRRQGDEFFAPLGERLAMAMDEYTLEQLALIERFADGFRRALERYGEEAPSPPEP